MENNKITALLVKVGEEPQVVEIKNHFRELQKIVGGTFEYYPVDKEAFCVCCDEGKINGMEGNRLIGNEIICGDFLIVGNNGMGETISLTPNQIDTYTKKFKTPLEFTHEQIADNVYVTVVSEKDFDKLRDPRPTPFPKKASKKKNIHER